MELKEYQHKVIKDLESFLEYVHIHNNTKEAFDKYWTDRIGPYNPIDQTGMEPYKNVIPNAISVCIKVPTAGGKTFIACNALHSVYNAFSEGITKFVVWLVPWSNLLDQTYANLNNPDHPYRQKLNALFNNRVEVYQKSDLLMGSNFNPTVVKDQLSIVVMSFSSLRSRNKEDRKVYQDNGNLESFVNQYQDKSALLKDTDENALINVIRSMNPVIVVDESHNAESDLSVDMLKALNPSFILDLTATPKDNSNIVSFVPAIELKKEHMVKLPVIIYNHHDKTEVVESSLHLQHKLEVLAREQEKNGGAYIRPIVLFQAQSRTAADNTTFEKLKEQLLQIGIPEEQIKIKTAEHDELKGIDLSSRDCPVRFIITINALKEGWDCPFAYILASLADKSSAVDVEQILGRVLRQPYVQKHNEALLNVSYVLTASAKFNETLQNIVKSLQESGYSENDYRERNVLPEAETAADPKKDLDNFLFPEQQTIDLQSDNIDVNRLSYTTSEEDSEQSTPEAVAEIASMAVAQNKEMEETIENQKNQLPEDNIYSEMGDKVKRYKIVDACKDHASGVILPRFYVDVPESDIFNFNKVPLNQELLLKDFKLSRADINISFDQVSSDLYKVDIEQIGKDEFTPRITKIDDSRLKEPIIEYILSKPKEGQIEDIAHQLVQIIGNMYPIPDPEIRTYIQRVLGELSLEQLKDVLVRKLSYAARIKEKIKQLADVYAETQFLDKIITQQIVTSPEWHFPKTIVPGITGAAIGNSLYEKEGAMNSFETSVITDIASLTNIAFWHRNLGRGKGFAINGYKSNHYPDFIVVTKSGKIILLETKGDDRDNSDSAAKCRLGAKWAELSGKDFYYFMVFDKAQTEGAYTLSKAKELIKQM